MRYLSVCSGIEAATVAWHPLGWQAAGFSEIDPFARALLSHHYPDVPLHDDFTILKKNLYDAIDLLVGGTPCQSFSIAGLRKGFADDRGNLALAFIRLAQKSGARWLVWENVPGVLSIDGGRTFGTFLGALAQCGYGFAYRILDAQYFGVPQRRRRLFVVGYLGDWRPAAAVLFEREGLCGNITPSRKARKSVAGSLTSRASGGGGGPGAGTDEAAAGYLQAVAPTLDQRAGRSGEHSFATSGGLVAATVSSKWAKGTGGPAGDECQNIITEPVAYNVTFCDANGRRKDRPDGGMYVSVADQAKTVTAGGDRSTYITIPLQEIGKRTGVSTKDASIGVGIGNDGDAMYTLQSAAQHGVAYDTRSGMAPHGTMKGDVICPTLRAKEHEPPMVTHPAAAFKTGQSAAARGIGYDIETAPSLESGGGGNNKPAVLQHMTVRRLTPRECERLQGFPDDYTLIPYRGKPAADGPRYKALGNSMAVPVMRWLGERIETIERQ